MKNSPHAERGPNVTHLSVGGGGASGFEFIGIFHALQIWGYARHIRHIASISIGTFFAAFFAMDYDMIRVRHRLERFSADPNALRISPMAMLRLPTTLHLYDVNQLLRPLKEAMLEKWPNETHASLEAMTLQQYCQRCGRELYIVCSNLSTGRPAIATASSPEFMNAPFLDVVRASMALPFLLQPIKIGGSVYGDGGITCDNPWLAFRAGWAFGTAGAAGTAATATVAPGVDADCALQIVITSHPPDAPHPGDATTDASKRLTPLRSIGHFLQAILQSSVWHKSAFLMPSLSDHIICVENPVMPLLPLRITKTGLIIDITPHKIEAAYASGVDLFLKWHAKQGSCHHPVAEK